LAEAHVETVLQNHRKVVHRGPVKQILLVCRTLTCHFCTSDCVLGVQSYTEKRPCEVSKS
jgi:hypothetical protein